MRTGQDISRLSEGLQDPAKRRQAARMMAARMGPPPDQGAADPNLEGIMNPMAAEAANPQPQTQPVQQNNAAPMQTTQQGGGGDNMQPIGMDQMFPVMGQYGMSGQEQALMNGTGGQVGGTAGGAVGGGSAAGSGASGGGAAGGIGAAWPAALAAVIAGNETYQKEHGHRDDDWGEYGWDLLIGKVLEDDMSNLGDYVEGATGGSDTLGSLIKGVGKGGNPEGAWEGLTDTYSRGTDAFRYLQDKDPMNEFWGSIF